MQCAEFLDSAKTFIGPLATIIASCVAAFVAIKLGRSQSTIAASQRDIAFDKLKIDLFDRRYAVYAAAKKLIEHLSSEELATIARGIYDPKVREWRITMDEAGFFFPQETRTVIERISRLSDEALASASAHAHSRDDDPARVARGDRVVDIIQQLTEIYRQLPQVFEKDMRFEQLVSAR